MAQQKYYTILTEVGKSKIANATVLNEKVQFSKMQLGDGGGSQYEPHEKQTALKNKVWEGSISNVKVDENNPNWIVVETAIPGNAGGWTVREVGIFDDEGELLAIGKYPETYKPVADDGCVKDLFVRVILMVVNTSSVALKIDPTVILASMKNLDDLRKELNAKVDATKTELNTKIDEVRSDLDSIELTGTKVSIEDVKNNFASTDVEGALKELADSDNSLEIAINNNKSELNGKIDDLKQSVSSGKQLIATATTGRGVPTNGSDSFQHMADNIDSIKTKLPILEDDVGVTEDSEGNVYGVIRYDALQSYGEASTRTKVVWENSFGSSLVILNVYESGNILIKYDTSTNSRLALLTIGNDILWEIEVELVGKYYYYNEKVYLGTSTSNKVLKILVGSDQVIEYTTNFTNPIGSIVVDKNDNVLITDINNNYSRSIIKLNPNLELLWKNDYGNLINPIRLDSMGNIIVRETSSSRPSLYKLNPEGETLWKLTNYYMDSVNLDKYGGIYATSRYEGGVQKFSLEGELLWKQGGSNTTFLFIDNHLEYLYYYSYSSSSTYSKVIYRLKFDGETLWNVSIYGYRSYYAMPNGEIYFTTQKEGHYIYKVDNLGKKLWSYTMGYNPDVLYVDLEENIYATNETSSILKINKHRDLIWTLKRSIPTSTLVSNEKGYYTLLIAQGGTLVKLRDNYVLEKVAVLKEREVTK
ncbi:phage tail protein [Clostridioides mangenotii]|uniref:phage tail-collar fiber domain-containing protein n=1 Tax=Metaclostridioides mangenotii TaxID=1540 RepID=UPI001C0F8541|nr:phage tail protein [Clostridioides mangenotii]MBU5306469.1 phage tail protein [Clostridioides mangenotii]